MIISRCAAVATTGVKVSKVFASGADGLALVFLLDVHVERVEVKLQRRAADRLDEAQTLLTRVEKVSLKTVERLDTDLHPLFLGVGREDLEVLHH